jgi:hypothetical protein
MADRISILRKQGMYLHTGPRIKELVPYGSILERIDSKAKYHSKYMLLGTEKEYMVGHMYLAKKIELKQIKNLNDEI